MCLCVRAERIERIHFIDSHNIPIQENTQSIHAAMFRQVIEIPCDSDTNRIDSCSFARVIPAKEKHDIEHIACNCDLDKGNYAFEKNRTIDSNDKTQKTFMLSTFMLIRISHGPSM